MVITKQQQKTVIDTQKVKRDESQPTTIENQITKIKEQEEKKGRKELQNNQKTMNIMATVAHIYTIT